MSVGVDAFISPFSRQSQLAPGADVILCASSAFQRPFESAQTGDALRSKNSVQLFHRQFGNRVVFVDIDDQATGRSVDVVSPGHHRNVSWVIVKRFVECEIFGKHKLAALRPEISDTAYQARNCRVAAGKFIFEMDVGLIFAKALLPNRHHAPERKTETANCSRYPLLGLIAGQLGKSFCAYRREPKRNRERENKQTLHYHLRLRMSDKLQFVDALTEAPLGGHDKL